MLEVNNISYEGYDAYQLKNELISLILLPAVGGRIVSYSNFNHEFLYTIPELKGRTYSLEGIVDIEAYRKDLDYVPAGGYKTWLAPQSKWGWPPYLDLAIGDYDFEYEINNQQLEFRLLSPKCRETGMQLSRTIILSAGSDRVKVKQGMKNCSNQVKEYGLWDVTQLKGQAKVIFPVQSSQDIKFLKESKSDTEVECKEVAGKLLAVITCLGEEEFKLGTSFSEGWILTLVEEEDYQLGYLKEFPVFSNPVFGHDCALEVFDTYKYDYLEVEVHGPMKKLKVGEETSFTEEWTTYQWSKNESLAQIISDLKI